MTLQSLASESTELPAMPPSAKLVVKTLEQDGELTQTQLAEQTLLAGRTVRSALSKLEAAGLVTARTAVFDARVTLYSLADD
jgi:DNA-binding MarR family transcriptional regulator